MASTTLSVLTPTLLGAAITAKTGVASSQTLTVQATTAQSALDFKSLFVRITNTSTTATVSVSLGVGTEYSGYGVGAKTLTTISSDSSVIVGGQDFEGARFLTSGGTIVFTCSGTGPTSFEAFQAPRASE